MYIIKLYFKLVQFDSDKANQGFIDMNNQAELIMAFSFSEVDLNKYAEAEKEFEKGLTDGESEDNLDL